MNSSEDIIIWILVSGLKLTRIFTRFFNCRYVRERVGEMERERKRREIEIEREREREVSIMFLLKAVRLPTAVE